MKFDIQALLDTLPVVAKGMAGVFIVTAVIILAVLLLNFFTKPRKKKDE